MLATPVKPKERGLCEVRNITIENVQATGAFQVFSATGLAERPIINLKWSNVSVQGRGAGVIENARHWMMTNVKLQTSDGLPPKMSNNSNVTAPEVSKR